MSNLSIILLSLSAVMLFCIILIYVKYWKGFKVISKSVLNEIRGKKSKSATISFLAFSLFFGVIFTIVLSAHTSNYYYEDKFYDDFVNYNTSFGNIHAGDITTEGFYLDKSNGASGEIDVATINGQSILTNPDDQRATKTTTDSSGRLFWSGGNASDIYDRDYMSKSDSCVDLINEKSYDSKLMESFSNSSPLYKIGSKKTDMSLSSKNHPSTKGLQNSYLYCADYHLAEIQKEFIDTNYSFSYSFNATSTFTGFSINNNSSSFAPNKVRVVTVPDANNRNTNDNGVIVNQPITSGEYRDLNLNEAYLLDFKHESSDLNSLGKNDYITLDKYSNDIKIIDTAESMQYIKPSDYQHVDSTISVSYESWIETNNIVLFVNEDTLYKMLEENYTDIDGDWNSTTYNTLTSHNIANVSPRTPDVTYDFFISMNKFNDFDYLQKNGINTYNDIFDVFRNVNQESVIYDSVLSKHEIYFRGAVNASSIPAGNPESTLSTSNLMHAPNFWASNDNFNYTYTKLNSSISSVNIFSFFILIVGLIVIAFLISRSFRTDVTWMGNLKSLGYSQSTISLLLVTKIIIYLLLGFAFTFLLTPLMNIIWGGIQSSAFSFALPLYYITWSSIAFTIFFPFLVFISFTFIVARFFFISKPTLSLVKDEILAKPNFLVKSLDNSNKLSFTNSYSMKSSIRTYAKSSAIFISSLSISIFILLSFSISDTLERSVDEYAKQYSRPNVSLITSPIKSGGDSKVTTISNDDFIEGINNGTITEYTFGIDETNIDKLVKEGEANGRRNAYCDEFDSIVVDYMVNNPISNTYIPNQTLIYLNEIFASYPTIVNCSDSSPSNAADTTELTNIYNAVESSLSESSTNYSSSFLTTYSESLGITLGYDVIDSAAETLMYFIPSFSVNILNKKISNAEVKTNISLTFVDKFEYIYDSFSTKGKYYSNMKDSDNGIKDGKVEFYINSSYVTSNGGTIFDEEYNFFEDENGEYMYLNIPLSFYSSNSNLTLEERRIKVYFGGYVDAPFITNAFLSLGDPDWDDILKSNVTVPGHSAKNNIFANSEIPPSSFPFVFLPNSNVKDASDKFNSPLSASYSNLGNKMSKSLALDLSGLNTGKYDSTINSYYDNTLTMYDLFAAKDKPSRASFSDNVYLLEDSKLVKKIIGNNTEYLSGIAVDFSGVITRLAKPTVKSFQTSVTPIAIMAVISAISLIFIVINEIIRDNKNNTNSLKTLGHSSFKTTIISYISYPIILTLGFAVSIPLVKLIGGAVSGSTGAIVSLFTLSIFPSGIQILYTFIVIALINILILLIAYTMTAYLKPKLSLYRE
ncbi:MAG: ABC transporter permease [Mycoplasmataceae bacterium]|nr:ABC transporter permease [Mycoplasmataceae bacterium]